MILIIPRVQQHRLQVQVTVVMERVIMARALTAVQLIAVFPLTDLRVVIIHVNPVRIIGTVTLTVRKGYQEVLVPVIIMAFVMLAKRRLTALMTVGAIRVTALAITTILATAMRLIIVVPLIAAAAYLQLLFAMTVKAVSRLAVQAVTPMIQTVSPSSQKSAILNLRLHLIIVVMGCAAPVRISIIARLTAVLHRRQNQATAAMGYVIHRYMKILTTVPWIAAHLPAQAGAVTVRVTPTKILIVVRATAGRQRLRRREWILPPSAPMPAAVGTEQPARCRLPPSR